MSTSKRSPLQISKIQVKPKGGELGISICPGIKYVSSNADHLDRNLEADVKTILTWNAKVVLTLMEPNELERFGVANIGEVIRRNQIEWYHLPVKDMAIPGARFGEKWDEISGRVHSIILCGGNVDMYLLGQIVSKGLATMGRMMKVFILLKDKPGALKEVVDELASLSANIVEVVHDRLSSNVPAGTTGVTLSLETENQEHAEKLIEHLKNKQIDFKVLT